MIVQIGFYALSVVAFAMVIAVIKYADQSERLIRNYVVLAVVWLAYLVVISQSGMLDSFSLPPRVPLLIVIPTVIASIVFTGRKSFRSVLEKVPLHLPVFLTSFRILVELLIYGAYRDGVFPQRVTFEGLNYDIIVGLSALIVGVLLLKQKFPLQGLLVWNIVSLLVLALTVYSFVSTYYFTDYVTLTGKMEFVQFPYLLLASVLLPIAIFLHVFSMRQLLVLKATPNFLTTKSA
jgi:hypothetical protein